MQSDPLPSRRQSANITHIRKKRRLIVIKSVEIKNLRGISDGKLGGRAPLSILVGPNGCGKSTVLDALHIVAHPVPPTAGGQRLPGAMVLKKWRVGWYGDPTLARIFQCAVKRRVSSVGENTHPATIAPAGSNRSSRGGNESAEAFGVEGRMATWRAGRP